MIPVSDRIHNLPFKHKLMISFMVTSIVSLVLACLIFIINDYLAKRYDLLNEATALADTLANNSTAAVTFDDTHAANEILLALRAHPNIDMAALFRKDGTKLARYSRNGASGYPEPVISPTETTFDHNTIHVFRPIYLEKEQIGRIYLRYDLTAMGVRQFRFIWLALFVLIVVSCVSYAIASRLMQYISKPVQNLVEVARAVSLKRDYGIRAESYRSDEIGTLSESFNAMLAQIQERDIQLVMYHEQLEMQVSKRTHELETANAQLTFEIAERTKAERARNLMEYELLNSRKLESIGVLAGGIAHDFNNILTAVVGFISLARYKTKDNEQIQAFLKNAENGCFRAKNLTQQLLTFARGGKPVRKITSLTTILREAIDISMVGSNVSCDLALSKNLPPANIDAGQIIQVFSNLLINACQAMPNGGFVTVSGETFRVDDESVLPMPPGEYIRVVVKDFGCGIAEEHLHRIFDPYFSTKPMGNGLGLATCYSIIKNHGGMITVSSEQEKGSTFSVYLPAADRSITTKVPAVVHALVGTAMQKESGRVLVMDDEEIVRSVAGELFAILGYAAAFACDGDEAIAMYRDARDRGVPFDITILDVTIPGGMGGVETVEKLLSYDSKACVIVSSGYANDLVMSHYRSHGFKGVLPKPYTLDDITALLRSL